MNLNQRKDQKEKWPGIVHGRKLEKRKYQQARLTHEFTHSPIDCGLELASDACIKKYYVACNLFVSVIVLQFNLKVKEYICHKLYDKNN